MIGSFFLFVAFGKRSMHAGTNFVRKNKFVTWTTPGVHFDTGRAAARDGRPPDEALTQESLECLEAKQKILNNF